MSASPDLPKPRRPSDVISETEVDGVCRVDPTTDVGRRQQLSQLGGLPLLPSAGLFLYLLIGVIRYSQEYDNLGRVRSVGMEVDGLVRGVVLRVQDEAAGITAYVATNGTNLLGSQTELYSKTDEAVDSVTWPSTGIGHYTTKAALRASITRHRSQLTLGQDKVTWELEYYQAVMSVLVTWVSSSLFELAAPLDILLPLTAYVQLVETASVETTVRLLGTLFFVDGQLPSDLHTLFVQANDKALKILESGTATYEEVADLYYKKYLSREELGFLSDQMIQEVLKNTPVQPLYYRGVSWDRRVGYFLEILSSIRTAVLSSAMTAVESKMADLVRLIIYNVVVMAILLGSFAPFMVFNAKLTMSSLRIYALQMTKNNLELRQEKRKADLLLKEMLPRQVAERLQRGDKVDAESFEEATVFFSDIPDFPEISRTSTPMEIVTLLNEVYRFMDVQLERYDVYKVETISCVYMVVSGVPSRNAGRHVREVARMSLDLNENMADFIIPHMRNRTLSLRIGISSGPCVAGVVGLKAPRYCLFGDTVNTAARMQTNGLPDKIHISKSAYNLLDKEKGFILEYRGKIHIKGKGSQHTYWLVSRESTEPRGSTASETSGPVHLVAEQMSLPESVVSE